jgi:hypothetical protein
MSVLTAPAGDTTYEFETTPFTAAERIAIHSYELTIDSGLRDSVEAVDLDHIRWHLGDFGTDQTRQMLYATARLFQTWHDALDDLLGDILTCTSEVTRYSTAAGRYVRAQAGDYHEVRQRFEHAVTVWTLGLNVTPLGDYPTNTRGVSLPLQCLTSEPTPA